MKNPLIQHDSLSSGGGSNTPPVDTITDVFDKPKLQKRVLIDWLSASFDFVDVFKVSPNNYDLDLYNPLFKQLVAFFGWEMPTTELPRLKKVVRGYTNGFEIGEHIRILYGGEHTKNASDRYSINLLLSGEACREFENFMDGNWNDLLTFLITNEAKIKRIDIAIDDFDGDEISIYEIEPFIRRNHYVSPSENYSIRADGGMRDGQRVSTGFSITFGSSSSSQLQIYDKKLERVAKGSPDLDTDIWYRYEMRFVDEKAQAIAETYTIAISDNYSPVFMDMAKASLWRFLDLKVPTKNDSNISRWNTFKKWIKFLDAVGRINLQTKHKIKPTMIRKKLWYETSLHKFSASLLAYMDFTEYTKFNYETMLKGFEEMFGDEKILSMINNGRTTKGLKQLTWDDIKKLIETLKYALEIEEE